MQKKVATSGNIIKVKLKSLPHGEKGTRGEFEETANGQVLDQKSIHHIQPAAKETRTLKQREHKSVRSPREARCIKQTVTSMCGRPRQEGQEFGASLSYGIRH